MPHFVITRRHGKLCYAVEFLYSPFKADGSKRWPQPIEAIEISDEAVRRYSLNEMINYSERGIRPKKPTDQPLALPTSEQQVQKLLIGSEYGKLQPRNMLEMG